MNQLCKVCGEPAAGFHFGAFTCEGCKSFFGRTYNNVSGVSECKNGGRCEITKKNRTSCKSCRLRKCLSVGMSKSGSRYGRRSNWFKIHCLLSAQNQNGISSSPETNNNNSTVTNNNNINTNNSDNRDRTPSSSASRLNGASPSFTSVVGMSPDSREQFLSSLNRNMVNPELCDYFRNSATSGKGPKPQQLYPGDQGAEDMSRTGRSPDSLESPNSEASLDDKSNTPLFTLPPGSPLDVKPNDFSPFDLLTRDLMKLGYDPLRLWPAMLTTPPNLHSFNPYRFIFPNFPTAAAFPGAFPHNPPPPMVVPPPGTNVGLHPSKMLAAAAAAAAAENLSLPLSHNLPNNNNSSSNNNTNNNNNNSPSTNNSHHNNSTNFTNHQSPANPINRRFPTVVPPSSSLTLTPPISHHGSDDPCFLSKKLTTPVQDTPIDLSVRSNNNVPSLKDLAQVKGEISDGEEEMDHDISDRDSEEDMKCVKSEYGDSEEEEEEEEEDEEEDTCVISRKNSRSHSRSHSRSSSSPKRERVSTPLDLTRSTSNHNSTSPPKIAT